MMQVEAVAYDNPIPGYQTNNTINLRLWAAKPSGEFDLVSVMLMALSLHDCAQQAHVAGGLVAKDGSSDPMESSQNPKP